ncbi:2-amino-4-hydroxy-6-hydroxymethyldihydropteridine pyrophosphokinase [Methylocaldum marinum]|uniref:2-amino-4-hydroxy-6-hydroxymethyldihydropteridine pyrophosphokinase n=1 Tax=Methylocaldum marinum TaxID=1432792 RepID=A0A250KY68_9GAMM|nr:2-amino-4-hydroxy-6-hydroxymethyldihydropteridine diphosphokinase [Methylocaldum marinum]BBA36557.1 2-amino-4-hydroxy-6-hydroxymethyldihydropteridine pyrophosphokinase [Methylocaldum marinum]
MCPSNRPERFDRVVAYIGLGANLDNPVETIKSARSAINEIAGVRELAFSSLYRSAPMGPTDQPDYVNAVMSVETTLNPLELLRALQGIETAHGRVRKGERWGPRTLDLDILLYGYEILEGEVLTVPHAGIAEREFVLYPLMEISPELDIPGMGLLAELVRTCPKRGLEVIEDV